MKVRAFLSTFVLAGFIALQADSAMAARTLPCSEANYSCTTNAYSGYDIYGYYQFGRYLNGGWHNCTSYAAYMLSLYSPYNSNIALLGHALTWDDRATQYGFKVSKVPHPGDIAQFNSNGGHVAYVEEVVYSNGSLRYIVISDDNISGLTTASKRYVGTDKWPDWFISFPQYGGGGSGGGSNMVFQRAPLD